MRQIKELIESDLKTHGNLLEVAIHYINYYFSHAKPLKEHHFIIKKYADEMLGQLIEYNLPAFYHSNLKENEEYSMIPDFNWEKAFLIAKINTYDKRKKLLFDWINNTHRSKELLNNMFELKEKIKTKNTLQLQNKLNYISTLAILTNVYSLDEIKKVKVELGLTESIESLQEKLELMELEYDKQYDTI